MKIRLPPFWVLTMQRRTKENRFFRLTLALGILILPACTSTFVSSWKAPDATLVDFAGAKVAAVVMIEDVSSRRMGEDILAREITEQGAQGIPMHTLYSDTDPSKEAQARAALERVGARGVVVMRPANVDREINSTPAYYEFWGSYYEYGWSTPWGGMTDDDTNTTVYVEARVYLLAENNLIWSGQYKTVNPEGTEDLIREASEALTDELENQGLLHLPFL